MAIGSFRRLEEIGRGSFATVYKAAYSVSTLQLLFAESDPDKFRILHSLLNPLIWCDSIVLLLMKEALVVTVRMLIFRLHDRKNPALLPSNPLT